MRENPMNKQIIKKFGIVIHTISDGTVACFKFLRHLEQLMRLE